MSAELEISYEVSQKMGMVLASCFEMVGLSTPNHITCDKMALVVDRIDKTRRALKKRLIFSTDENSGKIKEVGGGLRKKDSNDKAHKRQAKEVETEAFVLKQLEQEAKQEEKARKAKEQFELEVEIEKARENFVPFELECVREKTAIVASNLGIMRSQMKMLLKQQGYRVFLVGSLKELSFVIKNNKFDLVVTEVKEAKDIINIAKAKLSSGKQTQHMVISSDLNNVEVKQCCSDIGIDMYIEKHADWQQVMMYKLDKSSLNELKYA